MNVFQTDLIMKKQSILYFAYSSFSKFKLSIAQQISIAVQRGNAAIFLGIPPSESDKLYDQNKTTNKLLLLIQDIIYSFLIISILDLISKIRRYPQLHAKKNTHIYIFCLLHYTHVYIFVLIIRF